PDQVADARSRRYPDWPGHCTCYFAGDGRNAMNAVARTRGLAGAVAPVLCFASAAVAEPPTRDEAAAALARAVAFFRDKVSVEGTYVWRYSDDLSLCEGEAKATRTTAWVQSPGTPAVGEALLATYERTQEPYLLDAAVAAAQGLVEGELNSGGGGPPAGGDPSAREAL